ncbi:MAG: cytochrome c oxidase, cbb3-type, subunit FixP [Hyphomicrobiales bacterium]|jgi:cytochrome c oxidase cbb3-type subunit 3|nr:cytochrome c oxidase, cbb3-type, subunit FixP [Hyphomicrobiales bacterium]
MSLAPHDKNMVDAHTGVSTTGHEWDGIRELNTPLPRWWLWMLYATIVWAFGYMIVYPAVPLVASYTTGVFGWSSRAAVTQELAALGAQRAPMVTALASATLPDIEKNPTLLAFARAQGKAAFGDNCAGCHGAGGGGAKGYPNLVDDEWIWGGTLDDISQTLTYGIRSTDPKARVGNMPAFGTDGLLKPAEISQVADYVRSLSGLPLDGKPDLKAGARIFEENCAACHGAEGKGMQELGAPNLTDQIWLYGSDKPTIVEGLNKGRGAVMPHWGERLDAGTIKALAVYVHTLGGGR